MRIHQSNMILKIDFQTDRTRNDTNRNIFSKLIYNNYLPWLIMYHVNLASNMKLADAKLKSYSKAQQLILRRALTCPCGWISAKQRLNDTEAIVRPSGQSLPLPWCGVLHFEEIEFLRQSVKSAVLLAPRNPWANPPSFSFLQFMFLRHQFAAVQPLHTIKCHVLPQYGCNCLPLALPWTYIWPSPYDVTHPTRLLHYDYACLAMRFYRCEWLTIDSYVALS